VPQLEREDGGHRIAVRERAEERDADYESAHLNLALQLRERLEFARVVVAGFRCDS